MELISAVVLLAAGASLAWIWSLADKRGGASKALEMLGEAGVGEALEREDAPRALAMEFVGPGARARFGPSIDAEGIAARHMTGVRGFFGEGEFRALFSYALGVQIGAVDHLLELAAGWTELPASVQMALACHPRVEVHPEQRVALLDDAIARGGDLGARAGEALLEHDAWLGFVHDDVDADLRAQHALRALTSPSTPEDHATRDEALARVFASGLLGARGSSSAFCMMADAGWSPAPGALAVIARGAHSRLADDIIDLIAARGTTVEDAPALTALRDRGHGERVDPMLAALREGLDAKMMGRLSVSQSAGAQGGLTEAGGGGELEVVDEQG